MSWSQTVYFLVNSIPTLRRRVRGWSILVQRRISQFFCKCRNHTDYSQLAVRGFHLRPAIFISQLAIRRGIFFSPWLKNLNFLSRLTVEITKSHTYTQFRWDSSLQVIGLSQRPLAIQHTHTQKRQISMPSAGFWLAIPAIERMQICTLDRTTKWIDEVIVSKVLLWEK